VSWKSDAPIVGSLAFTTDGTLVAVTGPAIVTLDAKTLQVKETVKAPAGEFVTGPTIFNQGDREFIVAGMKNGHLLLIGGGSFDSPGSGAVADSLATWQGQGSGARWMLVPTANAVAALQMSESASTPALKPGWTASNLAAPATPIVVNGVVFALESGRGSSPAVLHAYEGTTGKELWTSGKTMTAAAAPGSFWSAFGQVYVGTTDGTLYAFGFNDERR
jgi:hypothetical protein